jgi:predicted permease
VSIEHVPQDIRFAIRNLRRAPIGAAVMVVVVAIGTGAATAIFALVNAWLLRPLPLERPEQLVSVWRTATGSPREPAFFDLYRDYLIWAAENRTLQSLAATFPQDYTLTGAGEPARIHGAVASWNVFATVGAKAELGRLFDRRDTDSDAVCLVSDTLWRTRFGSARDLVGRVIRLNDQSYRVVGVLAPSFSLRVLDLPFDVDAWTLITSRDAAHSSSSTTPVAVVGRLKRGMAASQAEADLNGIQRELNRRFPDEPRESGVLVAGLQQDTTRTVRTSLLLLLASVGVLLLIACVNAGSLILGRNSERTREFAVRLALGCGAGRLLQQLTTEVLLIFACGGALGVAVATALVRVFIASNPFGVLPPGGIGIDKSVFAAAGAVVGASSLIFGSIPAFRALRGVDADMLRARDAGAAGARQLRARILFVAAEISLSVVLLVGAGLLMASFARIASEPLGFQTDGVSVGEIALPLSRYPTADSQARFVDRLLPPLRALPSVQAAAVSTSWPFQANGLNPIEIEGRPLTVDRPARTFSFNVGPGYFGALGIGLLRGRDFGDGDRAETPRVTVINEALARQAFGDQDPLGQRIRVGSASGRQTTEPWLTIVGVVSNTRTVRYNHTDWDQAPAVYDSVFQRRDRTRVRGLDSQTFYIYFRSSSIDSASVAAAVHRIDPDLPVQALRSVAGIVSGLRAQSRLRATTLAAFGLLTVMLASVGVYGVASQLVEQRRREIGIRIALGAERSHVIAIVVRRTLWILVVGLSVGVVAAAAGVRLLRGLIYGVSPLDPPTFAATVAVLTAVVIVASYLPARRAAGLDPNVTLRSE